MPEAFNVGDESVSSIERLEPPNTAGVDARTGADGGAASSGDGGLEALVKTLVAKIEALEAKIAGHDAQKGDKNEGSNKSAIRLRPIDIKDVKKPQEYSGKVQDFVVWYERLKDLLINRHESWKIVLEHVEGMKQAQITNPMDQIFLPIKTKHPEVYEDAETYMQQMLSYLRTYTTGELYSRVTKTSRDKILELLRELVYRGRNHNRNRLVNLKAQALNPTKANKVADLDRVLTDWEFIIETIKQMEPSYDIGEDTRKTILLKIMPKEFIKDLRDVYNKDHQPGTARTYYDFEQALQDEISNRKMDEEMAKGAHISEVRMEEKEPEPTQQNLEDNDYVEVWVEDLECWVCGLAYKRQADDDGGDGARDDKKGRKEEGGKDGPKGGKGGKRGGKGGKSGLRGPRPGGPCWSCGGPHFQRECPLKGQGKGGTPISTAWASWRPGGFPGPTPQQWKTWMPRSGKGGYGNQWNNKGQWSGKGDGKGGGKLGDMKNIPWGPPLGQVQAAWQPQNQWQSGYGELVPLCGAVTVATKADEEAWQKARRTSKPMKIKEHEEDAVSRNAFAELQTEDDEDEFPEIDYENPGNTTARPKMPKMPAKQSQKKRQAATGTPKTPVVQPRKQDRAAESSLPPCGPCWAFGVGTPRIGSSSSIRLSSRVSSPSLWGSTDESGPTLDQDETRANRRITSAGTRPTPGQNPTSTTPGQNPTRPVAGGSLACESRGSSQDIEKSKNAVESSGRENMPECVDSDDEDEDARTPYEKLYGHPEMDGDANDTDEETDEDRKEARELIDSWESGAGSCLPADEPVPAKLHDWSSDEKQWEILKALAMEQSKKPVDDEQPVFGGHLAAMTFQERAEQIRRECLAERTALETKKPPTPITLCNELCDATKSKNHGDSCFGQWQRVSMAVDSGAAETVIPYKLVKAYPIHETEASKAGVTYASATGDPIPNLGEQRIPLMTVEGTLRSMTFQAAPVSRPLGSVMRMCRSGHRVVFDDEGSYVQNKVTGEINWLREENGNYMLDVWILPNEPTSFGRQP